MKSKTTIVCIFLVLILSMFVTCSFVACDKEDDNRIALTVDNVQQYVTLSCKGYGDPSSYKNGYYSRLFASASTEGIAGYEYENVFITVKINFDDGTNYADPEIDLSLNVGGNAYESTTFLICLKNDYYLIPSTVSGSTISANTYYEIISVSGYVKKA